MANEDAITIHYPKQVLLNLFESLGGPIQYFFGDSAVLSIVVQHLVGRHHQRVVQQFILQVYYRDLCQLKAFLRCDHFAVHAKYQVAGSGAFRCW